MSKTQCHNSKNFLEHLLGSHAFCVFLPATHPAISFPDTTGASKHSSTTQTFSSCCAFWKLLFPGNSDSLCPFFPYFSSSEQTTVQVESWSLFSLFRHQIQAVSALLLFHVLTVTFPEEKMLCTIADLTQVSCFFRLKPKGYGYLTTICSLSDIPFLFREQIHHWRELTDKPEVT